MLRRHMYGALRLPPERNSAQVVGALAVVCAVCNAGPANTVLMQHCCPSLPVASLAGLESCANAGFINYYSFSANPDWCASPTMVYTSSQNSALIIASPRCAHSCRTRSATEPRSLKRRYRPALKSPMGCAGATSAPLERSRTSTLCMRAGPAAHSAVGCISLQQEGGRLHEHESPSKSAA